MPALVMRRAGGQPPRADRAGSSSGARSSYGAERGVPWGVSESAYNVRDLDLTYQYSNFGVPGLGLERGLGEDLVVAPYATALAAMVDPGRRGAELPALAAVGARGRYGFYEALDYTPIAAARGRDGGDRARLHGAPPGHDARRARQRPPRRGHARALPRRADRPGDRAAAAGADAAGRRGRAPAARGGATRRRTCASSCRRSCGASRSPHGPTPAHAPPLQRALRGDADGRGLGLQPLATASPSPAGARTSRATAGGRTSSCATSRAARSGRPATSRPASSRTATGDVLGGPRGDPAPRRRDRDDARGARLARGRRRGPPRLGHEPRRRGRARSS